MSFTKLANKKRPNAILVELVSSIGHTQGKALDLGAGPLVESQFLLESGYEVDAVDKDPASADVASKINNKKFEFFAENIVDFNFKKEKYDLAISLLTLPFIQPEAFNNVFERLISSVKAGGYIYVSLFGDRDDWARTQSAMTFLTKQKIVELFKSFEIIQFIEEEEEGQTVRGGIKKWHIFSIVAKKL